MVDFEQDGVQRRDQGLDERSFEGFLDELVYQQR